MIIVDELNNYLFLIEGIHFIYHCLGLIIFRIRLISRDALIRDFLILIFSFIILIFRFESIIRLFGIKKYVFDYGAQLGHYLISMLLKAILPFVSFEFL